MTRIERFLHDNSRLCWLITVVVYALFGLWATQLNFKNGHMPTKEEMRKEKINTAKMSKFLDPIVERANKLGRQYNARHWFLDLKAIEMKDKELDCPQKIFPEKKNIVDGVLQLLQEKVELNEKLSSNPEKTWKNHQKLAREYAKWQEKHGLNKKSDDFGKLVKEIGWVGLLSWLGIFYLRGIPLCLILYLVRMRQRKGILATILADKKAFILALLGWPCCIWKYPYNILREIVVEAELRRYGNIFRRFKPTEKELVVKIANSEQFTLWRSLFNQMHKENFKRSLLMAILATILLHLIAPTFSEAKKPTDKPGSGSIQITKTDRAGPPGYSQAESQDTGTDQTTSYLPKSANVDSNKYWWPILIGEVLLLLERTREIGHVPLRQLVFDLNP